MQYGPHKKMSRENSARRASPVLAARTGHGILASPLASQNRKRPMAYPPSQKMARKIQSLFAHLKFGCAEFASRPPSLNEGVRVVGKAVGEKEFLSVSEKSVEWLERRRK